MLLKGQTEDEVLRHHWAGGDFDDERKPDEADPEDLPSDDEEEDDEEGGLLRGVGTAVAAFIPAFVVVFFGLPYLVGSLIPTLKPGATDAPLPAVALSPPVPFEDPRPSASPEDRADEDRSGRLPSTAPSLSKASPSLPPGPVPREEARPQAPGPVSERRREPPDSSWAIRGSEAPPTLTAKPRSADSGRTAAASPEDGRWTPAAAFGDRHAAASLAASIQRQGYSVEVRHDSSATRPWVVWIGPHPQGSGRRR